MKRLAIIGSSELAKQIAHFAISCDYVVAGYFDDFKEKGSTAGGTILGKIADVAVLYGQNVFDEVMIGTGYKNMALRRAVFEKLRKSHIPFATIVHPSCLIDKTASINSGTILYPGCIIDQNVTIKENVLINLGCIISHDSIISGHSFLSPAVNVAGFCRVGELCNLGISTTVIDNISICDLVQTGGGALVARNIDKPGLYVGVPAKLLKHSQ